MMLTKIEYDIKPNYRFLDNSKDKVIGVVLQTKNYAQFKNFTKLNREIDKNHANKLIKKLKEDKQLILEPILVDKSFKVVDGQHRLYALSKLNLPVNYMIDDKVSIVDAPLLNSYSKNWSAIDYVQAFANKGNTNYQYLAEELQKYKTVSTINIISLTFSINRFKKSGGGISKTIREGKYQFDQKNQIANEGFFNFIAELKHKLGGKHKIPGNVQEAIRLWYFNPQIKKDRLNQIIDKELVESLPRNTNLCAQALGEAYNNRLRNKVNYYIDNQKDFHFVKEA